MTEGGWGPHNVWTDTDDTENNPKWLERLFRVLVNTCALLSAMESWEPNSQTEWLVECILSQYGNISCHRYLTEEEVKELKKVLPSETTIARGFQKMGIEGIENAMWYKSMTMFLVRDFPHLRDILYDRRALKIDQIIEDWTRADGARVSDFADIFCIEYFVMPSSHCFWQFAHKKSQDLLNLPPEIFEIVAEYPTSLPSLE